MPGTTLRDSLLAGPRGRRFLLELAILLDEHSETEHESLNSLIWNAAYWQDPARESIVILSSGAGADASGALGERTEPEQIAAAINGLELPALSSENVREALCTSVSGARYWQSPEGSDVLAGTAPVTATLSRIAQHVADWPGSGFLHADFASHSKVSTAFDGADHHPPLRHDGRILADWRRDTIRWEEEAGREFPAHPAVCPSSDWWSTPPFATPLSTAREWDGGSGELWFTEDELGWERAQLQPLGVPAELRVFEIMGAEAWAELCRRFPLDVSAQKRGDWYSTTGRSGAWVIPDWHAASEHFDAIHLPFSGYLAAAGTAIPVDDERASVIAGWAPGSSYWLTDCFRYFGEPETWAREDTTGYSPWKRVDS